MKTIINLFNQSVEKYSNKTFLWEKTTASFIPITYTQTKEEVYKLAAGLINLGIQPYDKVALLSEGRNAWIISELAILHVGAINVPLSIKLEESNDLLFRLQHSETKYIIVSGSQVKKIRAIIKHLPLIQHIIVLDADKKLEEKEITLDEIVQIGNSLLPDTRQELIAIATSVKGNDIANISYTSGTTADPKGIMLSHRNYTANVEQAMSLIKIGSDDSTLIILPLDHCFAHVAGFYSFMAYGANVATVQRGATPMETLRNIPLNIKEFKPTVIMSVPALAKNFRKNIETSIKSKGKFTEKLFQHALHTAYDYNREGWNKKKSPIKKLLIKLYDKILFARVREAFGGRLKFFIGGGALLDIELQRFFYAIGIPMFQGYGLSEATPVISSNAMHKHKLGSSGFLVDYMKLKICDEEGLELPVSTKGEIVIQGENVMLGYWKNPQATNDTIRNGWLYTGDMGCMDKDGYLYVLGRFKSLLIASDGEKYNPEGIEEALMDNQYIDQLVLHNNQDPYTVALVVPNKDALKKQLQKNAPSLHWDSVEAKKIALQIIQETINRYRSKGELAGTFPERWLPAAIAILPEAFTEQNQLVNSTMKIVRSKVVAQYSDRIVYLYTPQAKDIMNKKNIESLK